MSTNIDKVIKDIYDMRVEYLREKNIELPLFDSSCNIGMGDEDEIKNALFLISTAASMKSEYVSIRSDSTDESLIQKDIKTSIW